MHIVCTGAITLAAFTLAAIANAQGQPASILKSSLDAVEGFQPGMGIAAPAIVAAEPVRHPSRILIRFEPFADRAALGPTIERAGVREIIDELPLVPGLVIARISGDDLDTVLARLNNTPGVRYAEADPMQHAEAQSTPFGLFLVNAPAVWSRWGKGNAVKICVLDTGVDTAHPDLPATFAQQSFITSPVEDVEDLNTHGTHVSGTILAIDNTDGVVGAAPQATLLIGKVLANSGSGPSSAGMAGINWAVANRARVINMSLSGSTYNQSYADTVQAALDAGTLVVCAMGNQGDSVPRYPAAYPASMPIAAVNANAVVADFSNFGPHCSVAAPGVGVQSSVPIVQYRASWLNTERVITATSGSAARAITAPAVYCGFGALASDFPASVSGRIAHIRRGGGVVTSTKVFNALAAGAIGVIQSNNTAGTFGTSLTFSPGIPVTVVSQADGDQLQANDATTVTIWQVNNGHTYASKDGTSMSTPHVAAAAGLLFGNFVPAAPLPPLPPLTVRWVLERTAIDKGQPGKDDNYGWGLIDAEAASKYLHGRIRCPGDLNADNSVDDADFQQFVTFYDALLTPGGPYTGADFNGDDATDDLDFQTFAVNYDALLCP